VPTTKNPTSGYCHCGCNAPTKRAFAPGHDNRFYGQVRRGERPEFELEPFPALMNKLAWAKREDAAKAERKANAAKVEVTDAGPIDGELPAPAPEPEATTVKVGRWVYSLQSVEPIDGEDNLVRVGFLTKDGELKFANVAPKALA
jgi:hypothetical protein